MYGRRGSGPARRSAPHLGQRRRGVALVGSSLATVGDRVLRGRRRADRQDAVLVETGRVVFLGHVVRRARRSAPRAVGVPSGTVRARVIVADVLSERLAGRAVEDDDAAVPRRHTKGHPGPFRDSGAADLPRRQNRTFVCRVGRAAIRAGSRRPSPARPRDAGRNTDDAVDRFIRPVGAHETLTA